MMQTFSFRSGHSSEAESATEMHSLDNRRQRRNRRQLNTAESNDTEEMVDAHAESPMVASTGFDYLGSLSPSQKKHKFRSFEKLEVEGFDEAGYLSDSSLPSMRQSLARNKHLERDMNEETPLLSPEHSITDLDMVEQNLDDDDEPSIMGQIPRSRRKEIKKYGKQIKIAVLFAIMLASVVSNSVLSDFLLYFIKFTHLQIMFATRDDEKESPGIIAINHNQSYSILTL